MVVFGGAGGRGNEGALQVDGLNTGAALNGAGVSSYVADIGNAQEVSFTTSGGLGEAEVGGPAMNIVPKTGGNTIKGNGLSRRRERRHGRRQLHAGAEGRRAQRTPGELLKLWDFNGGVGGPIKKDRVWYFLNVRDEGSYRTVPGMFANMNAGDPSASGPTCRTSTRPAQTAGSWPIANARARRCRPTPRNKFNLFWDEQHAVSGRRRGPRSTRAAASSSPGEIIGGAPGRGRHRSATATAIDRAAKSAELHQPAHVFQRVQQATWSSPVTNRLLLEAGVGTSFSR